MQVNHDSQRTTDIRTRAPIFLTHSTSLEGIPCLLPEGLLDSFVNGGILSLLLTGQENHAAFGGSPRLGDCSSFSLLAYQAYDSWKRQLNEVTGIPTAMQFHHHGLSASGISPLKFELEIVKMMIAAVSSNRPVDDTLKARTVVALDAMPADDGVKSLLLALLSKDTILRDIDCTEFALPLKTEIYLAALMIVDDSTERGRTFLKQLANHMAMPPQLTYQIHLQVRLQRTKVA